MSPIIFPEYFQLGEEINISSPITRCYQCSLASTFGLNEWWANSWDKSLRMFSDILFNCRAYIMT
jgi:hypothetical protein